MAQTLRVDCGGTTVFGNDRSNNGQIDCLHECSRPGEHEFTPDLKQLEILLEEFLVFFSQFFRGLGLDTHVTVRGDEADNISTPVRWKGPIRFPARQMTSESDKATLDMAVRAQLSIFVYKLAQSPNDSFYCWSSGGL